VLNNFWFVVVDEQSDGARARVRNRTGQVAVNPHNTVFDTKRLIGRKFGDDSVREDVKLWPFKVEAGPAGKPMIRVDFKFESKVGGLSVAS
jgi:molecular chaperone DnaK (HSP70)